MRSSGVCVAVVLWLCAERREALTITNSSSSCVEIYQCFDIEYSECVNDTTAIAQPVNGMVVCFTVALAMTMLYICIPSIDWI